VLLHVLGLAGKLYEKLYLGQLIRQPSVEAFVKDVWELVGASQMSGVES
jgi:hypothetical protein